MNRRHHRFLPRASLALALVAAATLALPASARGPKGLGGKQGPIDPELASARKQLAAATVVAKLELSKEQKVALQKILTQARDLREEGRNDADARRHRARAKALLLKATDEVRASGGEMSADTRAQLAALRAERAPDRTEHRSTMQALMQAARNVLTPEQQQKLQQARGPGARGEHGERGGPGFGPGARGPGGQGFGGGQGPCAENPEACMGRGPRGDRGGQGFGPGDRGPGARQGKHRGKKLMHLLLSDEFLAELSR